MLSCKACFFFWYENIFQIFHSLHEVPSDSPGLKFSLSLLALSLFSLFVLGKQQGFSKLLDPLLSAYDYMSLQLQMINATITHALVLSCQHARVPQSITTSY